VEYIASTFGVVEGAGNATITVRRRGGTLGTITVTNLTSDLTAVSTNHYIGRTNELVFASGETIQTFNLQIIDDTVVNPDRTVFLNLNTNSTDGATLGLQPFAILTITNDDSQIGFSTATYSVSENTGVGAATITVVRSGGVTGTAFVDFLSTTNGTATSGLDFAPVSGTISFAPGETTKTFSVPILNNNLVQGNRIVELILTNFTGQITPGIIRTLLTIIDKDRAAGELNFSQANYFIDEGSAFPGTVSLAVVTVARTNGSTGAISVNYFTANGTATGGVIAPPGSGVDYLNTSGTLSFADGETNKSFTVPIILDDLSETDETINLTLVDPPTGGAELGAQSTTRLDRKSVV